jgi:hypothetical protein
MRFANPLIALTKPRLARLPPAGSTWRAGKKIVEAGEHGDKSDTGAPPDWVG